MLGIAIGLGAQARQPDALHIAELLRQRVNALRLAAGEGHWQGSISLDEAVRHPVMADVEDLLRLADPGLYAANRQGRQGRNRVVTLEHTPAASVPDRWSALACGAYLAAHNPRKAPRAH